jgi:hypothetical protein
MPRGRESSGSRSSPDDHGERQQSQSSTHPPLPPLSALPHAQPQHRQSGQGTGSHAQASSSTQLPPLTNLSRLPPLPPGPANSGQGPAASNQHHGASKNGASKKFSKSGRQKTPEQARYWNTVLSSGSNHPFASSSQQDSHLHGHGPALPPAQTGLQASPARTHSNSQHSPDSGHEQHPHHQSRSRGGSSGSNPLAGPSFHAPPTRHRDTPSGGHSSSHRLRCAECSMEFGSHAELSSHFQNVHNPDRTYPCKYPGCSKVFGHRSSRSRHEKTHRTAPQI